jgi:hypothetical protein
VKREADVALRVVYETSAPPPRLNGSRLQDVLGAVYATRKLLEESGAHPVRPLKWLLWAGDWPPPAEANIEALHIAPVPARFSDTLAQAASVYFDYGVIKHFRPTDQHQRNEVNGDALIHGSPWRQ